MAFFLRVERRSELCMLHLVLMLLAVLWLWAVVLVWDSLDCLGAALRRRDIHTSNSVRNNNDTIWGGSVLTGEEPPLWGVEACSQAGGPTQSRLLSLCRQDQISMEHRLRRKHQKLNSDASASNETFFREVQEKRKRIIFSKKRVFQKKNTKVESPSNGPFLTPCPPRPKNLFHNRQTSFLQCELRDGFFLVLFGFARTTEKLKNEKQMKKLKN